MKIPACLLMLTVMAPVAAFAAPPAVQRLSDEQVERVLAEAAAKREAAEAAALAPRPGIHGEAGVEVGTGGHRAAYGTAFVPIGSDGAAIVSFVTSTGRNEQRRRR